MANSYVEFVKKYAKDNNIKYGEALSKSKSAWKEHKSKNPTTSKKSKPKSKTTKGGNIDMDIQQAKYQGVSTGQNRRKLLSDYNKVVKEVDNGLDLGFLTQAKYDEFKEISLTLGSGSKTNKYAKKLKKVEKEYNSVKYKKKANKKIKLDSKISKEELKKLALSKSTQIQLQRDLGFKGARQQASVNKTIFENRVRQLIRAGATRDEAEAIAKEEETQRKEQTTLEQQINLERIRQARGSTILPKGKLSTIANFTKNYAKTKGISFKDAQQQVKVQNLYRKYELQHLRGTAPTIPSTISISSSRVGTSSNIPTNILGRSKFLKKDGDLKKMFQDKLDKYLSKYHPIEYQQMLKQTEPPNLENFMN